MKARSDWAKRYNDEHIVSTQFHTENQILINKISSLESEIASLNATIERKDKIYDICLTHNSTQT